VNQTENCYFIEEIENMHEMDFQDLVKIRLEDMANQVELLVSQGNLAEANLLHRENLLLAASWDSINTFLYVDDLRYVQ
jgi:hypothetical protein